jgi:Tol biopolymer transport system component
MAALGWLGRSSPRPGELRLDIATPLAADTYSFAVSPDGQQIVFVAGASRGPLQLWLRALDSATAVPLPDTEGAVYPFWSPDAKSIGFFANGKLRRVDLSGGAAVTLADAAAGRGGSWSVDGQILFTQSASGPISVVSATGSAVRTVTSQVAGDGGHVSPMWHPDGRRFLFFLRSGDRDKRGTYLMTVDRPDRARLLQADGTAEFRGPSEVMYVREGTLYVQAFDAANNVVTGAGVPVASPIPSILGRSAFSASRSGPVAYRAGRNAGAQLRWFTRHGESQEAFAGPDAEEPSGPRLSPSGQRVAIVRSASSNSDVWIVDGTGGALTRLTMNPAQENFPVWMPDESAVAFRSSRGNTLDIYVTRIDAGGSDTLLLSASALGITQISPSDISRDGRWLFPSTPQGASRDVWVYPIGQSGAPPRKLIGTSADESNARFSPDGRWIAYQTNESGRFEVAVRGFPSSERMWQVSAAGGVHARWSHDGRQLFYVAPDGQLMAVGHSSGRPYAQVRQSRCLRRALQKTHDKSFNPHYDAADGCFCQCCCR